MKQITILPYNPEWPHLFQQEATHIAQALGENCLAIHHIGSTSVPGLSAKPKIDMIVVVQNPQDAQHQLEPLNIQYKGEYNIPLHYGFSKRGQVDFNIHVYEKDHPEIALNIMFRDYLRNNPVTRTAYEALKKELANQMHAGEKGNFGLPAYTLRKGTFIREVLKEVGFNELRILKASDDIEWSAVKNFRNTYFFNPQQIEDPYLWTLNHPDHTHVLLYQGSTIIGYAHVQFWPDKRCALRMIAIDTQAQCQGKGSRFLQFIEKWLKVMDIQSIHVEARNTVLPFYLKNGYIQMPFNDPENIPTDTHDIAMGKKL